MGNPPPTGQASQPNPPGQTAQGRRPAQTPNANNSNAANRIVNVGGKQVSAQRNNISPLEEENKRRAKALAKHQSYLSGGILVTAQWIKNRLARKLTPNVSLGCVPSTTGDVFNVYANETDTNNLLKGGNKGNWLCGMDNAIKFNERRYQVQNNEYRLFIEGAEVTHYVEGTLSWTMESTGGMNTCRFTLNNTHDAFILTPENICAHLDKKGWRLANAGKQAILPSYSRWRNWAADETAKFTMYQNKWNDMFMEGRDKEQQIDPNTGMWLYPLGPYRCIIHKHDAVRLFIRLPQVSSVKRPKFREYYDLWAPAFTGFVKEYSWDDDPVQGTRKLSVTCYDYRGLMARMRVRTGGVGVTSKGGTKNPKDPQNNNAKTTDTGGNNPNNQGTENYANQFLKEAEAGGLAWFKHLTNAYSQDYQWPSFEIIGETFKAEKKPEQGKPKPGKGNPREAPPPSFTNETYSLVAKENRNPFKLMIADPFNMDERLRAIWKAKLQYHMTQNGAIINPNKGANAVPGMDFNLDKARDAAIKASGELRQFATRIMNTFAYTLQTIVRMWQLRHDKYRLKVTGKGIDPVIKLIRLNAGTAAQRRSQDASAQKRRSAVEEGAKWVQKHFKSYRAFYNAAAAGREAEVTKGDQKLATNINGINTRVQNGDYGTEVTSKGKYPLDAYNIYDMIALAKIADSRYKEQLALDKKGQGSANQIRAIRDELIDRKRTLDVTNLSLFSYMGYFEGSIQKNHTGEKAIETELSKSTMATIGFFTDEFLPEFRRIKASIPLRNLINTSFGVLPNVEIVNKVQAQFKIIHPVVTKNLQNLEARTQEILKTEENTLSKLLKYLEKSNVDQDPPRMSASDKSKVIIRGVLQYQRSPNQHPRGFPFISLEIQRLLKEAQQQANASNTATQRGRQSRGSMMDAVTRFAANGFKQSPKGARTVADAKMKNIEFDVRQARIFADLVRTNGIQPHPLAGKSFEDAVKFLCTEQLYTLVGAVKNIETYTDGILEDWNKVVIFGAVQRPITYAEVSVIGLNTIRNNDAIFNPLNNYMHMLRPEMGTAASTLIQTKSADATGIIVQQPEYETRLDLLNKLCEALDYQFFISPMGDFVFELPAYNSFPQDYGEVFKGAYMVDKDWIRSTISEENKDIPTGYIFHGLTAEQKLEGATASLEVKGLFKTFSYMWTILARRHGVSVQHVNLNIPGVGDPTAKKPGGKPKGAAEQQKAELEKKIKAAQQVVQGRTNDVSAATVAQQTAQKAVDKKANKKTKAKLAAATKKLEKAQKALAEANKALADLKAKAAARPPTEKEKQALNQLEVYAYFYMQRQLGRMHTFSLSHPFRPYVVPNRPIWLLPRQRIGLPQSITHSMTAPDGTCNTELNIVHTREMFRDGQFRFTGGGPRQPVDYAGIFTGTFTFNLRTGVGAEQGNTERQQPTYMSSGRYSSNEIINLMRQSSKYSSAVGNSVGGNFRYNPPKPTPPSPPVSSGEFINPAKGGVQSNGPASQASTQPNKQKPKQGTFRGSFLSPWSFGAPVKGNKVLRAWGYTRLFGEDYAGYKSVAQRSKYESRKGARNYKKGRNIDYIHSGIDIILPKGSWGAAPMDIDYARAVLYAGNVGKKRTVKISSIAADMKKISFIGGSKVKNRPGGAFQYGAASGDDVTIWGLGYDIWAKVTGRKKSNLLVSPAWAGSGIIFEAYGYVHMPFDPSVRLRGRLDWVHCEDTKGPVGKKLGVNITGKPNGHFSRKPNGPILVRKGQPLVPVSWIGSTSIHIHMNLSVRPIPGDAKSMDAYKQVLAANRQYLETQLVAIASGWKFDPNNILDPTQQDGPAASYWQRTNLRTRRDANGKYRRPPRGKVQVREIVDYYKRRRTGAYYRHGNPKLDRSPASRSSFKLTNPAFFFKCAELVYWPSVRGNLGNVRELCQKDEPGAAVPAIGGGHIAPSRAAYVPTPPEWCKANSSSRSDAANASRSRKEKAKANQEVAANPGNKPQVDQRQKAQKAKEDQRKKDERKAQERNRSRAGQNSRGAKRQEQEQRQSRRAARSPGTPSTGAGAVDTHDNNGVRGNR